MSKYSVSDKSVKALNLPPATSRAQQRDATKRDLVHAGLRMVAERGFAATTTAAIAQASGKAHGTVFLHFKNRDAMVAGLVEELGRTMSQRLAALPGTTASLVDVLDAHLAALFDHEVLYARLLCEASTLPLAARARVFALQSGVAWRLREAHAREVLAQTARPMAPVALANIWIALTNHYLMNRDLFAPGASVIATHGGELKAQLLEIVRPSPTPSLEKPRD
jgi:AcrR family transcriptional regulator